MSSAALRRVLFTLLFLSLAMTTLPQLVASARQAARLLPLTHRQRMEKVVGRFYSDTLRLRSELPPGQPVAMVLRKIQDVDVAVFFNYYIYPWTTRVYHDLGAYRNDSKRPQILIGVDATREPSVKWVPYAELRAEHAGNEYIVRDLKPFNPPQKSFDVSMVASLDGPAPDMYMTEAVVENAGAARANVKFEFFPSGKTLEFGLDPAGQWRSNDLVHEAFALMEQGWLRVTSDQPLRSGFWFVNRGRRLATTVPLMVPRLTARVEAVPGAKFYVVNPGETALMVRMADGEFLVGAREFITGVAKGPLQFESDTPFYAFASWRDGEKRSLFAWQ